MDRFAHYDWPFLEGKHQKLARDVEAFRIATRVLRELEAEAT